jgi:nitrate reductase delta subunit
MRPLERIGSLFAYPIDGYAVQALEAAGDLDDAPSLRQFADAIAPMTTAELQEQFVETFDLQADCSLDLGWHLFGERYERGEWLARLRADLRRTGVGDSLELPDHITNVLVLLDRDEPASAAALATQIGPAFDRLHEALARRDSPYRYLVDAAREMAAAHRTSEAGVADG